MDRRKIVEYGVRPKPRDTHTVLCDGAYCARHDCEQGKRWREAHRQIIVDGKLRPAGQEYIPPIDPSRPPVDSKKVPRD